MGDNNDYMPIDVIIYISSLDDVEGDTEVMSGESEPSQRDPRFLLYWMTTTSTSTLTSFTATTSIGRKLKMFLPCKMISLCQGLWSAPRPASLSPLVDKFLLFICYCFLADNTLLSLLSISLS